MTPDTPPPRWMPFVVLGIGLLAGLYKCTASLNHHRFDNRVRRVNVMRWASADIFINAGSIVGFMGRCAHTLFELAKMTP